MKKLLLVLFMLIAVGRISAQNCAFTAYSNPSGVTLYADTNLSPSNTNYLWTFSNGLTATGFNPTVALAPGAYSVCIDYVNGALGTTICSYCDSIYVGGGTTCNFMIMSTPGSNLVDFHVTVPAGQMAQWSFGDGTNGTGSTPWHNYASPGTYQVCVQLIDMVSQVVTCTSCQTLTLPPASNNCNFNAVPDSMNGLTYYFYASPAYQGSTISWTFGDNTSGVGSFVSHTYAYNGVFVACMNETDSAGVLLCSSCVSMYVDSVGNCGINAVNLQGSTYSFSVPSPVMNGNLVSWDFGDGTTGTGSTAYHSYTTSGIFNVCVTITDSTGWQICSNCTTVVDSFNTFNCNILFSPMGQNTFLFSVPSNPSASGYVWDFGDGTTGSGNNVQHTYAAPGVYNVTVNVTGLGMILCTSIVTVAVSNPGPTCSAYFMSSVQSMDAYFVDLSTGTSPSTSYSWDFGDGSPISTLRFPQHTYPQPGFYMVCLTISDGLCVDTFCSMVQADTALIINPGCQAYFATVQLAPYQLAVINFSNGMNLNFAWDFGDGSTSNQAYPSHQYANTGSYNLCLTVSDMNGCTDTYCDTISVDSMGYIFRSLPGFTISVLSPSMLSAGINDDIRPLRFTAYPNPVNDLLTLERDVNANGTANYRIINLQGAVVLNGTIDASIATLSLGTLAQGAYLLEVVESNGYRSYRNLIKY